MNLRPSDFPAYFRAVHGCDPFPWQHSLVTRLSDTDTWPDVLNLPTGSGKTAALDAAVFHLAMRADTPSKSALRIALVVDRRLVVDDAFVRATKIAGVLEESVRKDINGDRIVTVVAKRLQRLAGGYGPPLVSRRLRGGAPLEYDWAKTPTQPTILCSTVDQVGSRLLFRGYGVSDRMKPVHAGLLGSGCLILLDEAHLSEPFRQTLYAVRTLGRASTKLALLSATPGVSSERPFQLTDADRNDPELSKRLRARKPAALRPPYKGGLSSAFEPFAREARAMADRLRIRDVAPAAVGIVVNRVALARRIFDALRDDDSTDAVLMIGRSRGVVRDAIAKSLARFRTGSQDRTDGKPLFVVATQCLEVGVDLDLDGLVTQAASLDALQQRFGRLNRAGRPVPAEGTIIALSEDIGSRADDPVYGDRIRHTWDALQALAEHGTVDFGFEALSQRLKEIERDPAGLASERQDAPVLMPAYLDLWSKTSPRPTADPDVGLFLHGRERSASGVSVVWRDDILENDLSEEGHVNGSKCDLGQVMQLMPPRASEAIELPLWIARAWLDRKAGDYSQLSDAPEREPDTTAIRRLQSASRAFRWAGLDHPDTRIVSAGDLRPGDVLVVPAGRGGCDRFGWAPESDLPVADVADCAAKPYWGRRCAIRITPSVFRPECRWQWRRVAGVLGSEEVGSRNLVDSLLAALPPQVSEDDSGANPLLRDVRGSLTALSHARGRIDLHLPYANGPEGGAVLVAKRGTSVQPDSFESLPATEDDTVSHTSSRPVALDEHGLRVARFAEWFAETLGLGDIVDDLRLAAYLHDAGKADPRFQTVLAGGDPWNRPDGPPLAKSGRAGSPRAWKRVGLPRGWRHEALSVRMARTHSDMSNARDPALVLWLIGSHHGLGRPFFDFRDNLSECPQPCLTNSDWRLSEDQPGPQSLAFDFGGVDWPSLFNVLKRRYGVWGLAHLEAILRLADHRASEEESSS